MEINPRISDVLHSSYVMCKASTEDAELVLRYDYDTGTRDWDGMFQIDGSVLFRWTSEATFHHVLATQFDEEYHPNDEFAVYSYNHLNSRDSVPTPQANECDTVNYYFVQPKVDGWPNIAFIDRSLRASQLRVGITLEV